MVVLGGIERGGVCFGVKSNSILDILSLDVFTSGDVRETG